MDKQEIIGFFNQLALRWDAEMIRDDEKIGKILDFAAITSGVSVLDVGCGTGVLFPDYLSRGVKRIIGVDISPAMIEKTQSKFSDPRITLFAADIFECAFDCQFDRCMVYNAFPHFPDPVKLIDCLAEKLAKTGRLTIAHGMSRAQIDKHHSGHASKVSMGLISEKELAALLAKHFEVDVIVSNDEMYVVSGVKI